MLATAKVRLESLESLDHEIEVVPSGDRWQATLEGEPRSVAAGPDGDGGLLLETATEGVRVFHSGEVSVHRE